MSYTSRPAFPRVVRGGRGRGVVPGQDPVASAAGATGEESPDLQPLEVEPPVQQMNGFTMFAPNQKKRDKIAREALREEDNFNKYKERQKMGHVSYVGTVGGGLSVSGPSQPKIQLNRNTTARKPATVRQYRPGERTRELSQPSGRKTLITSQTERNASKEMDRKAWLDEDRRQKNDAFLKQFEKGSKSSKF